MLNLKNISLLVTLLLLHHCMKGQSSLTGHITEMNGNPVIGVVVRVIGNESLGAQTDFEGYFKLRFPANGEYIIHLAFIGFEDIYDTLVIDKNTTVSKEYIMLEKTLIQGEVTIQGRAIKSTDNYMERIKMNAPVSLDYISSETIKKTGDANVINAIARVAGVSTNGGLITVRGIGDRYVRTTMNGSRIPTLDPMTNNIKLDIFPNSLIDNIVITKTYTPELPGDWAGAYISVETKDYPDKLLIQLESQIGYNTQSTFKEMISSQRSATDWLGHDNGMRLRTDTKIESPTLNPTTYQEMVALGLGEYYNDMGIFGWQQGTADAAQYFRLGLVQLGLLGPALINDEAAVAQATQLYNTVQKPLAYSRLNPEGKNYDNHFNNNWNTRTRVAPLNHSQSFSLGNQIPFFKRELGFIVGFKYSTNQRYDANGLSQRVGDETLGYPFDIQEHAQISRETNAWSALLSTTLKLNEHHKLTLLFMPNVLGNNDVAKYTSIRLPEEYQDIDVTNSIFYEQRRQLIYQATSSHYIPKKKIKIDFNSSYTSGRSLAPDFKATQYLYVMRDDTIVSYQFSPAAGDGIRRYYRLLNEKALDANLAFEMPLSNQTTTRIRKVKIGGGIFRNFRKIDNDEYRVMLGNNPFLEPLTSNDLDSYMSADRFTMQDGFVDFTYLNFYTDRNHSFGHSNVHSAYAMTDYALSQKWRMTAGLRAEYTSIYTDVDTYDQKNYARNDPRRENVGGFPFVNPGEIEQLDVLPSVNLIHTHFTASEKRINTRLSYNQNIARPSIRELSDAAIFDNEFRTLIYGNSDLKIATINNYDLRFETYFNTQDNISISAFYKSFTNHIEMGFGNAGITWENIDQSRLRGIEIEGNKQLLPQLSLKANLTLVKSEAQFIRRDFQVVEGIKVYTPIDTLYRPMYGQAPYIINGILTYSTDSLGFTITASYNLQGPRLVIAGSIKGRPDVYEIPRHVLDIKASQKIGPHFIASLTVRDLLNSPIRRSYKLPTGYVDYDHFKYGTNLLLSLAYKF